jgi:hypothetical protein
MLNITFERLSVVFEHSILPYSDLMHGRRMIIDCLQSHPSDFPELTWTGTEFRILPDDPASD